MSNAILLFIGLAAGGVVAISSLVAALEKMLQAWEKRQAPPAGASSTLRELSIPPTRDQALHWFALTDSPKRLPLFLQIAALDDGALGAREKGWWCAVKGKVPVEAMRIPAWRERFEDKELLETGAPLQVWRYHASWALREVTPKVVADLQAMGLLRSPRLKLVIRITVLCVTVAALVAMWTWIPLHWLALVILSTVHLAAALVLPSAILTNTWRGEALVQRVRSNLQYLPVASDVPALTDESSPDAALPHWQALCGLGTLSFEAAYLESDLEGVGAWVKEVVLYERYGEDEDTEPIPRSQR